MTPSDISDRRDSIFRRAQWSHWFALTAAGGFVMAGWFWLMPRGFPGNHLRTLANVWLPLLACLICLLACIACARRRPLALPLSAVLPGVGAGLAVGCVVLFPQSMLTLKMAVLSVGLIYLLATYGIFLGSLGTHASRKQSAVAFVGFLLLGAAWAATQRAPDPTTLPLNVPPVADAKIERDVQPVSSQFRNGSAHLYVQPFLEFRSLSPDRFWTLFAPRRDDSWVPGTRYMVDRSDENTFTTWCKLEADSYSHLNTFTELEFSADGDISIAFSPCPNQRIAVRRAGYPFGEPARFAFLDVEGMFRIVEANSAEKGPFTELASGICDPNHMLELTLYSGDSPAFIVRFDDFFAQCSRELSPTAGWGAPQNSIEFSLADDNHNIAFIFMSLASTSVGRGFDSVGHQRGIYRNRMRVELPARTPGR